MTIPQNKRKTTLTYTLAFAHDILRLRIQANTLYLHEINYLANSCPSTFFILINLKERMFC